MDDINNCGTCVRSGPIDQKVITIFSTVQLHGLFLCLTFTSYFVLGKNRDICEAVLSE